MKKVKTTKKWQRMFAAVMCVAMVLTMASVPSFAATPTGTGADETYNYTEDFSSVTLGTSKPSGSGWYETVNAKGGKSYCKVEDGKLVIFASAEDTEFGAVGFNFGKTFSSGKVEIGFKAKFVGGTKHYQSRLFLVSGGYDQHFAAVSSGSFYTGTTSVAMDDTLDVKYTFNAATGDPVKMTINGEERTKLYANGYSSVSEFKIKHFMNKNGETSDVTLYIDDFYVKEIPDLKVKSASVANNESGVDITAPLSIVFNQNVDAATAEAITLTNNGVDVKTGIVVDGKTVTVNHNEFDKLSTYVLTIPETVASTDGAALGEAKTITFNTMSYYIVNEDFAGDLTGWSGTTTTENGRLKLYRETSSSALYSIYTLSDKINSGKVKISFKFNIDTIGPQVRLILEDGSGETNKLFSLAGSKIYVSNKSIYGISANQWYKIDAVIDIGSETIDFYKINDEVITLTDNSLDPSGDISGLRTLKFLHNNNHTTSAVTVLFDDVSVLRIPDTSADSLKLLDYNVEQTAKGYKANAVFKNGATESKTPWVGVAVYDSYGVLKSIGSSKQEIAVGETDEITANLEIPGDIGENPSVKLFIWDDALLQPLHTAITVK